MDKYDEMISLLEKVEAHVRVNGEGLRRSISDFGDNGNDSWKSEKLCVQVIQVDIF